MAWLETPVSAAEAIVRVLEEAGIDMVFGMPGGNVIALFDALYDHKSTIRTVLARDESLASVMAEAYGRLTGKPGVVIGQSAFLVGRPGVLEALLSDTPLLILTESSDGVLYSHHAFQSATGDYGTWDARGSFTAHTKQTMVPRNPAQAVQQTQLAIKHAVAGEPGPVAMILHSEVLKGQVGPDSWPRLYATGGYLPPKPAADPAQVREAARLLVDAKRPVIVAGNGVLLSRAGAELVALAEQLDAVVVTSVAGKSVIPETHPLAAGPIGRYGVPAANHLAGEADVVLIAGSRLSPSDTANEAPELLNPDRQTLIQLDIEPRNAGWVMPTEHVLAGDARLVLGQLLAEMGGAADRSGAARVARAFDEIGGFDPHESVTLSVERRVSHPLLPGDASLDAQNDSAISPVAVVKALDAVLADDATVTFDAGDSRVFMSRYFRTRGTQQVLQPAGAYGMGYAVPAALAAKLVHPDRQAVATTGDGAFAMVLGGLVTAVEERIPIVVVVFNNSAMGMVMHSQKDRAIATQLATFDNAAIARAIGCQGWRVESAGDLERVLRDALACGRPAVVDVITAAASVPPSPLAQHSVLDLLDRRAG